MLWTATLSVFAVNASGCACNHAGTGVRTGSGNKENGRECREPASEGVVYASPGGTDGNAGTQDSPYDIYTAVANVAPGGTIYLMGGTYSLTAGINCHTSGTESQPIRMWACPGAAPVFDAGALTDADGTALRLYGDWWHICDLTITGAYWSAFDLKQSSHITLERCTAHHNGSTGFTVGYDHGERVNADGERAAWNTFLNCDSYNNFDWYARGTNTDGYAVKACAGKGNRFVGCRAWSNSDDNWDFFECNFGVVLTDCWCWSAGNIDDHRDMFRQRTGREMTPGDWAGDGNGFKMGGGCYNTQWNNPSHPCQLYSEGTHLYRNCISFDNRANGFDQNQHLGNAIVENCLSFGNFNHNYTFYYIDERWEDNKQIAQDAGFGGYRFRNNISFGARSGRGDRFNYIRVDADLSNVWAGVSELGDSFIADQFVSGALSAATAGAARGPDGSLPALFGVQKSDSCFRGRGDAVPAINIAAQAISVGPIVFPGGTPMTGPVRN